VLLDPPPLLKQGRQKACFVEIGARASLAAC
jgi:hypothetical protein